MFAADAHGSGFHPVMVSKGHDEDRSGMWGAGLWIFALVIIFLALVFLLGRREIDHHPQGNDDIFKLAAANMMQNNRPPQAVEVYKHHGNGCGCGCNGGGYGKADYDFNRFFALESHQEHLDFIRDNLRGTGEIKEKVADQGHVLSKEISDAKYQNSVDTRVIIENFTREINELRRDNWERERAEWQAKLAERDRDITYERFRFGQRYEGDRVIGAARQPAYSNCGSGYAGSYDGYYR